MLSCFDSAFLCGRRCPSGETGAVDLLSAEERSLPKRGSLWEGSFCSASSPWHAGREPLTGPGGHPMVPAPSSPLSVTPVAPRVWQCSSWALRTHPAWGAGPGEPALGPCPGPAGMLPWYRTFTAGRSLSRRPQPLTRSALKMPRSLCALSTQTSTLTVSYLCDPGWLPSPFCASVSPSVKRGYP